MDAERKKLEQALREAIVDAEELRDKLWEAIKDCADNDKRIDPTPIDREYKLRVQPAHGRLLTRAKEIRLHRPTTKGIDVTGSISEHFEFDLRDDKLCLKHNGKPVTIPEVAQWIVEQLFTSGPMKNS